MCLPARVVRTSCKSAVANHGVQLHRLRQRRKDTCASAQWPPAPRSPCAGRAPKRPANGPLWSLPCKIFLSSRRYTVRGTRPGAQAHTALPKVTASCRSRCWASACGDAEALFSRLRPGPARPGARAWKSSRALAHSLASRERREKTARQSFAAHGGHTFSQAPMATLKQTASRCTCLRRILVRLAQ